MEKYTLLVNGTRHVVEAAPETPLLWVLRDTLNLTGTKYGCGEGQCGSCTVLLNGAPAQACVIPVSAVKGRDVTTIEGLSPDGTHPLQKAWIELDVSQCGYCQPGQLMSAAALLARTPHPTDADIDQALNNNLCRCGTYLRIRKGVHRAAELAASTKEAAQ